jgi:hypothetical protein
MQQPNESRKQVEAAIRAFLSDGTSSALGFFDYEFRIVVQKWDEASQTVGSTKAIFDNLTTLRRDLSDKIGPGQYFVRVLYRTPYDPGWGVVTIERYSIAGSADLKA